MKWLREALKDLNQVNCEWSTFFPRPELVLTIRSGRVHASIADVPD